MLSSMQSRRFSKRMSDLITMSPKETKNIYSSEFAVCTTRKQPFYIGSFTHSTSVMTRHRSRQCWKSRVLQQQLSDRCRIPHVRRRVSCKTRCRIVNILHRLLVSNHHRINLSKPFYIGCAYNQCRMSYFLHRVLSKP